MVISFKFMFRNHIHIKSIEPHSGQKKNADPGQQSTIVSLIEIPFETESYANPKYTTTEVGRDKYKS